MSKDAKDPADSTSILGPDLQVEGNMVSKGTVQIDGTLKGDVRAKVIVISKGATVEGALRAESISVWGTVKGQVLGRSIKLMAGAEIDGDLCYKSLAIEEGASFEGKCRRADDPASEEVRPAKAERNFRPRTSRTESRSETRTRSTNGAAKSAAKTATNGAAKPPVTPEVAQRAK